METRSEGGPGAFKALERFSVGEAMHPGLVSCSPDTPLRTIARMMATYRVHAILVTSHGEERLAGGGLWGIVTDLDLLLAAEGEHLDRHSARDLAATPVVMIPVDERLARAAELMAEHRLSHLIVVEPRAMRPIGVVSTLDVARALAGFPERHPGPPAS